MQDIFSDTNKKTQQTKCVSIELANYIQGYTIEREYGNKPIEICIKNIVSFHNK